MRRWKIIFVRGWAGRGVVGDSYIYSGMDLQRAAGVVAEEGYSF